MEVLELGLQKVKQQKTMQTQRRNQQDKAEGNKETPSKAYHRILTTDGITIKGPLCIQWLNSEKPAEWHLLEHEEPHTIWVGGTLKLDMCHKEILTLEKSNEQP